LATAPAPARPRPGGGRLFIIVGLLLALLAGAGVFFLGGTLNSGSGGIQGGNQTVVVAKQNIGLRHQITSADLTTASAAGSFIAINAYTRPSDVVNLIAEINIKQGSIITSDMLARDIGQINAGSGPAYLPLASGYVAMTIPTSEQQGVAGHITLGDYITIIASANVQLFASGTGQAVGPPKVVSKTVFTNIRIIGVGPAQINVQPAAGTTTTTTTQPTGGVTSSLTIELTQCDSEYMVWFLNNMQLRYTLESFNDYLKSPPSAPDPSCPTVIAAQGVSNKTVDARYHFSTT
jgi:Flp pilus assembly protein CpaB